MLARLQPVFLKCLKSTNIVLKKLFPWAFDIGKKYPGGFPQKMTKSVAQSILGVKRSDTKENILSKYRKLIMINHPDKGGSANLTLKINEAKDFLLQTQKDL